jgi:TonB family protein
MQETPMNRFTISIGAAALLLATTSAAYAAHGDASVDTSVANRPVPYPDSSQRNNQQGTVRMLVKVSRKGHAQQVRIVHSSGYDDLDDAAAEGVLSWHYKPATYGSDWADVQVVYQIPPMIPAAASKP